MTLKKYTSDINVKDSIEKAGKPWVLQARKPGKGKGKKGIEQKVDLDELEDKLRDKHKYLGYFSDEAIKKLTKLVSNGAKAKIKHYRVEYPDQDAPGFMAYDYDKMNAGIKDMKKEGFKELDTQEDMGIVLFYKAGK